MTCSREGCGEPRHERSELCTAHRALALVAAVEQMRADGTGYALPFPCHLGKPCSCDGRRAHVGVDFGAARGASVTIGNLRDDGVLMIGEMSTPELREPAKPPPWSGETWRRDRRRR